MSSTPSIPFRCISSAKVQTMLKKSTKSHSFFLIAYAPTLGRIHCSVIFFSQTVFKKHYQSATNCKTAKDKLHPESNFKDFLLKIY